MTKTQLVNQKSKMPTRKLMAMIIATGAVQGGIAAITAIATWISPEAVIEIPAEEAIAALIPLITGYMTKERA